MPGLSSVMPGLVPGIHAFTDIAAGKTWMAGINPAMTLRVNPVMTLRVWARPLVRHARA